MKTTANAYRTLASNYDFRTPPASGKNTCVQAAQLITNQVNKVSCY